MRWESGEAAGAMWGLCQAQHCVTLMPPRRTGPCEALTGCRRGPRCTGSVDAEKAEVGPCGRVHSGEVSLQLVL